MSDFADIEAALPPSDGEFPAVAQIVFDLDGVLAEPSWPLRRTVGRPIPEGIALLRHMADKGYSICINTARPQVDEPVIWKWVLEHRLPVDKVRCEKPMASLYIDDKGWRFER